MDYQPAIDAVDHAISNHPGKVVLVFLVMTGVFTVGLGNVETSSGQGAFLEDVPSWQTFQETQDKFFFSFSRGTSDSTTVYQTEQNVLSKPSLIRALKAQKRLEEADKLRVTRTSSPAVAVARQLDPTADSRQAQIRAVRQATPGQIDAAVERAAATPGFTGGLSDDFNRESASASTARLSLTHANDVEDNQDRVQALLDTTEGDFDVFGPRPNLTSASLVIVLPAAVVFIILFLTVAYRDLVDLLLGGLSLVITTVWTFGILGIVGIDFSILMVTVPPLLLAVGIDFGIHSVNRYREERITGKSITESMWITTDQLLVAFFIVTGTTVIGFLSNLVSLFSTIQEFGIVAAIGIVFTFLTFGIFLPAAKVKVDRWREQYPIPTISDRPLGSEGSILGRLLSAGTLPAQYAPYLFLALILVSSGWLGVYATGVESGFGPEDFNPAPYDEVPNWLKNLPAPFAPPEYDYTRDFEERKEKFGVQDTYQVWLYVETDLDRDTALERLHQSTQDPPPTLQHDGRQADSQSIVTVIQSYAEQNPQFRQLVRRNDRNDNGIPDDNLDQIYDALLSSPVRSQALTYMTEDRRAAIVIFTTKSDVSNQAVADDMYAHADKQTLDYRPTGSPVIFSEANSIIMDTVVQSLAITLVGALIFLVLIYRITEGWATLGLANMVPIVVTVILVVASMRYFGVKFNSVNGVILSITIGLGIDYSVHVTHRFADEIENYDVETALDRTIRGTGGALTGSMLTTVSGIGVLVLALSPPLRVFGLLTGLSVFFAYVGSIVVLPPTLVVWNRLQTGNVFGTPDPTEGEDPLADPTVDTAAEPADED